MVWSVEFEDAFEAEFLVFEQEVQDALLAVAKLLVDYGPQLGRPYADTLKGSKHANMKELRFEMANGAPPSPSTLSVRRSCSSPVTNPAGARNGSTNSSSPRRIGVSPPIWKS